MSTQEREGWIALKEQAIEQVGIYAIAHGHRPKVVHNPRQPDQVCIAFRTQHTRLTNIHLNVCMGSATLPRWVKPDERHARDGYGGPMFHLSGWKEEGTFMDFLERWLTPFLEGR